METNMKNLMDLLTACRSLLEMSHDVESQELSIRLMQTVQELLTRIDSMLIDLIAKRTHS